MSNNVDIFRVDNYSAAATLPYRVRIDGVLMLDCAGLMARRFRSMVAAERAVAAKQVQA